MALVLQISSRPQKLQHSQLNCLREVVDFAKHNPTRISAAVWVRPYGEKADYDLYKAINDDRKYIKAINEFYGEYQAGEDAMSRAPLNAYTFDDCEPGIVYSRGGNA